MIAAYLVAMASVTFGQSVTPAATLTGVDHPTRLAATAGGGVYVTDQLAAEVVEFNAAGTEVARFPIPEGPIGIATGPGGQIYVSLMDGTVGIYDATFASTGALDPSPMTFVQPNGVAVHPVSGEVYVADMGADAIMVFDAAGVLQRAWGMEGSGLGQHMSSVSLAIDASLGRVLVADTDNFRVQEYDTAGTLLGKFGYKTLYVGSTQVAWLARTSGIAVDTCSNIYLADALMGTVRVFNSSGVEIDYTTPLISVPATSSQASFLTDMIIAGGKLYLANNGTAEVDVYDLTCSMPRGDSIGDPATNDEVALARKGRSTRTAVGPDNPFDIVQAMRNGQYDASLDLNQDRRVNTRDLDIAVASFGAATSDDFLAMNSPLAADFTWGVVPPHMIDIPNQCGRCHSMNGQPGGITSDWGQANLCGSCHVGAGVALEGALTFADKTMHHPTGVAADSGGVMGPAMGSDLLDHLDGGDVRCGTCHEPHAAYQGTCQVPANGMPTPQPHIGRCMDGPKNGQLCEVDGQCNLEYLRANGNSNALCGECHEEYHEWQHAGHSDELADPFSHYQWSLSNRSACRVCHSGDGFIDASKGMAPADQRGTFRVIDCLTCHATHGEAQADSLLRVYDDVTLPADPVNFPGGLMLTNKEGSATCMTCHNGRTAPPTQNSNPTPVSTPHYALGGVMLEGINAVEFGNTSLTNSPHTTLASCVDCHMAPGPASGPGAGKVGGHTWHLAVHDPADPDFGFENAVSACGGCHPGLTTLNRPSPDYDGDGVAEGVMVETQGLLDLVFAEITARGAIKLPSYPYWDLNPVPSGERILVKNCIWNWQYVTNSGDLGVKNTSYAVGVLQLTYEQLTGAPLAPPAVLRYVP
ncbi:MAG: SMP-30/gluconolactonase/LRE family protein [Phycisphaerae bacterium]|nr:SMP-30/gluconolactonase/LRE family protein [Phycisphaerae bacterium]